MPELETRIAGWRRAMLATRIKSSVLEELESHLREDIEHMMQAGTDAQEAFDIATQHMGPPDQLRKEFQKVPFKPFIYMTPIARRRLTEILVVVAMIATSAGLFLPMVAKWKAHEALSFWDIAVSVIWMAVTVIAGGYCAARVRRVG
jgi:hypothetical protein